MKKFILSFMVCFCFVQMSAQTGWDNFNNAGTSIAHPSEWTAQQGFLGGFIVSSPLESDNDDFSENVNYIVEDLRGESMDAETYAGFIKVQLDAISSNNQILKSKKMTFNGQNAYMMEYKGRQGDLDLHSKQIYIIKDGKAHVLTYVAESDKYNKLSATAEKMFKSFKM